MIERTIPSSGERLPVIGLGTWQTFDVSPSSGRDARLADVLARFASGGGRVIDSSPMYGRAEETIGRLREIAAPAHDWFLATKIWTRGESAGVRQVEDSMRLMRTSKLDLVQVHNLVDWKTHLRTIRKMKDDGRVRYAGITHYQTGAFGELESIMRGEEIDFVQLPYSAGVRAAEERLLPMASERGIAVIVNRPFEEGSLVRRSQQQLPQWASDAGFGSVGEMLLSFVVSNPSVTVAIPATSNPEHVAENLRAGVRVVDEKTRELIAAHVR